MSEAIQILVPDIGDFEDVDVIDILVSPGQSVVPEDPLITLESDKATMDIPAPAAGTVADILVKVGDKVSEGSLIVTINSEQAAAPPPAPAPQANDTQPPVPDPAPPPQEPAHSAAPVPAPAKTESSTLYVTVPDIGDFDNVDVIDVMVAVGDAINPEDPLITLESDKATMDVPAPMPGTIESIGVKVGDKVSQGDLILTLSTSAAVEAPATAPTPQADVPPPAASSAPAPRPERPRAASPSSAADQTKKAHASPSVRKFARELGVDVGKLSGTGPKNRILKSDVKSFVKTAMQSGASGATGFNVAQLPDIDFAKFGPVESTELSKIKKLTGVNMHRAWVTAPHVFQMDEADITELEAFRKSKQEEAEARGAKLTLLAFLAKACVAALRKYPNFNASLSNDGQSLVLKHYYHIGMAVNTEQGLLVPVVRDVDKKGLFELASEMRVIATKARDRKLSPADMQGGCFTISSLGGVGGTAFTPIINVPEVAILGVSPAAMKPVYRDDEFVPRLMLPFTLSYDHRVIDGVAGAQFTSYLTQLLSDIRQLLL
ncbi:MAG: dihydrolipoyllysine-residue acetyltransferase [Pseudomonadota bacterium]